MSKNLQKQNLFDVIVNFFRISRLVEVVWCSNEIRVRQPKIFLTGALLLFQAPQITLKLKSNFFGRSPMAAP